MRTWRLHNRSFLEEMEQAVRRPAAANCDRCALVPVNGKEHDMFSKTAIAALSLAYSGSVFAGSCVQELNYQQDLRVPALETWATDSLLGGDGSAEVECRMTQKLSDLFVFVQEKIATESTPNRKLRGTHAKGLCLNGTYQSQLAATLSDAQKAALKQAGLFGSDDKMAARFRFANASSRISPDWNADVRALSIKVALPAGGEQDFAFNNVPRFQLDSLDNFVNLLEMQKGMFTGKIAVDAKTGAPSPVSLFNYFVELQGVAKATATLYHLNNIKTMSAEDTKWEASYAQQNYWSTTAFGVGRDAENVVKFGAMPCSADGQVAKRSSDLTRVELLSEAAAQSLADSLVKSGAVTRAENYLSESLVTQLNDGPVCYNLFVQFLNEEKSVGGRLNSNRARELVENPSLVWDGPIHVVGQLLMNEAIDERTCDDPVNAVSVIANNSEIHGLGQINRAREFAEAASRKNR